jgi:SHAQKYF class myb-like DNA-binding protein
LFLLGLKKYGKGD